MSRPRHFDRHGNPISFEEWTRLFESTKYRVVEQTRFSDGSSVSTIWLGPDHGFSPDGRPVIFETMNFPDQSIQLRCCTEAEALVLHQQAIAEHLAAHPELSQ